MADRGRYLFTVWPFPGHVFPHLAVATALRRRGHECVFYTGERMRGLIEGEGFEVESFRAVDEGRLVDAMLSPDRGSLKPREWRRLQQTLRYWLTGTLPGQADDLTRVVAERRPQVIACDPAMWAPPLILHRPPALQVAILSYIIECPLSGPDAPPFGLGLPRPRGPLSRLRNRVASAVNGALGARVRRDANALRARFGQPPIDGTVTDYLGRMPLYVVPSTPSFDYDRRDLPSSVQYVGAVSFNRPGGAAAPEWLARIRTDRPWIHATEGTVQMGDPVLLRTAARAFADRPVELIITTGGTRDPDALDLGVRAPNIHVARFIPHDDLLPRISALAATGGAGAVAAALSHGVPIVCVPQEWDHAENAQRVYESGAGLRLSWRTLSPERLRAAVSRVIAEPSFREHARRLGRDFRALGGPSRAAELLERLLSRS